jgi:glycosyltransferase involved in cell wall biosynthesis
MTDPLGQSQVLPYLKGIAAAGYEITLISFEKDFRYQVSGVRLAQEIKNLGIHWYPLTYTKNPPVFSTLWDIQKLIKLTTKLNRQSGFEIVHCRSYITAFVGHYLQKKFGMKFIFDMRGFWADERVEGKLWNLNNPVFNAIFKYFKRKEKQWLQDANQVVCLTESAKKVMEGWGVKTDIQVIPCCVDTELFDPQKIDIEKVKLIRQDLKIDNDQIVLGYLGSIGTWYMLDEMLIFFKSLKEKHPDAVFVFLTAENPNLIIEKATFSNISTEDLRIREVKRTELPNYLSIFNFSLCFVKPGFSKMASSPTKLGELMSMGIPVICNAGVGDIDQLLAKYESGYLLKNFNGEEVKRVINLINLYDKNKIRNAAVDYYSLEKGVGKYLSIYAQMRNPACRQTGIKVKCKN